MTILSLVFFLPATATSLIQSAMQDYHSNTCLRFVPRTTQRNYIKLFAGQG